MPTLTLPLVGSYMNRNPNAVLSDAKDQQFINGFPELYKNPVTGKGEVFLNKRQGATTTALVQASATGSYGAAVWSASSTSVAPAVFSYVKSGSTSTMFFNTAGTQIGGDIANTNNCLSAEETDVSGTGTLTAMLTDNSTGTVEAWYYPEGGAWTQVTSAPLTTSPICPAHAHMDGYQFVMREDGNLFHSALNTVSSWPALNFIAANSYPDNGNGCARYRNLIFALGDYSGQFYYNAGNEVGSVLSRIENATLRVGAIRNTTGRGTAIRTVGTTVYWIGTNGDTGARGIYRLNGMQAEKVSNAGVDKLVANGAIRSVVGPFSLLGATHIAFSGGGASLLCYCADANFWWTFTPAGPLTVTAMIGTVDSSAFSKSYFSGITNANVYAFDPNAPIWQDNAAAYTLTAQTAALDLGTTKKKIWDGVGVVADKPGSSSNVGISYSDDDGVTFSTERTIDINSDTTRLYRWGASRRRIWKFTHAANTSFRAKAIVIDYRLGL